MMKPAPKKKAGACSGSLSAMGAMMHTIRGGVELRSASEPHPAAHAEALAPKEPTLMDELKDEVLKRRSSLMGIAGHPPQPERPRHPGEPPADTWDTGSTVSAVSGYERRML